ncbi:MAG: leucine--tRNA ligase [Patescibacteria group bacterium]
MRKNSQPKKKTYDHKEVEKYWQKKWDEAKLHSPDLSTLKRSPFYNLWMFPYPSAEGLHAGHAFASTGSDVYGRFMRMQGQDVFQPFGYDSFGIHSENYALKIKEHPQEMLARTTKNFERQVRSLGHGYDWTRTVTTSDIDYYTWTQWLFAEMFKAGLAYRTKAFVNWCPSCKTVLADEQVIAGNCERCNHEVEQKELAQWFFRITDYADRLLENLNKIKWPDKIKTAQRNWIGKSTGAEIKFKVKGKKAFIDSFTTRPDTLFGATFLVLSPEHPQVKRITTPKHRKEVENYVSEAKKKKRVERTIESREKTGVFTGGYVINPVTNKEIPVFVADYVLMDYGTGAIMGVPAHDERDWDFAKKYDLPIIEVISGGNVEKRAYIGSGKLVNSGNWNGLKMPDEMEKVIKDLEKQNSGKASVSYHLRDWLISRQRYWGPPIPMIYCPACAKKGKSYFTENKGSLHKEQSDWDHLGWYPEENLPVKLPYLKDYKPKGTGRGPLADHPEFYETKCPICKGKARRETDVSDTFLDSSWYFIRYPSVGSKTASKLPFDPVLTKKCLPPDLYFGGAEHSVLHLMYARFVTMLLFDLKKVHFEEPFPWFFAHGLMIEGGAKMSKSRGNVVNPDQYIEKFGADAFRLYLMFIGPIDGSPEFRDTGMEGMKRFVERIWKLYENYGSIELSDKNTKELLTKMHQTIQKVTKEVENFRYNTAIANIMEFVNLLYEKANGARKGENSTWGDCLKTLCQLLAPFAPHMTEEIWVNKLAQRPSIHVSIWPKFNSNLVKEKKLSIPVQVNGKLRSVLIVAIEEAKDKEKVIEKARKDEKVKKWLKQGSLKNTIFVPGKLVNFVIR